MVVESFATAVEYYFTLPHYPNEVGDDPTTPYQEGEPDQSRSRIIGDNWAYTPFFIDLIDNTNQRTINGGSTDFADDDVKGYTLEQIQKALDHRTTLWGVEKYLKDEYDNPTEKHIKKMRDFYEEINDNH